MKRRLALIALLGLGGCQYAQQRKPLEMHNYSKNIRKEMQKKSDFSEQEYNAALDRKYDSLFGKKKPVVSRYPDETLKQLFKMYDTLSFYTLESRYLAGLEGSFAELTTRGLEKTRCSKGSLKNTCVENMFSAYITQGDLLNAKKIQQAYPELLAGEQLPEVREPVEYAGKSGNLYKVSADGKYFDLVLVEITKRPVIVSIMSTGCHFSKRSLELILTDPELKRAFEENALIVLPLNSSLSFIPDLVRWNKENPKLPFLIYSNREDLRGGWERFDFTSLPQFYFLKDGKTVYHIGGWGPTEEDFKANLRKGIAHLEGQK